MQKSSSNFNKAFLLSCLLSLFFLANAQPPAETRGVKVVSNAPADTGSHTVYAIIMGISNYPGVTPLKYADKDAILFSKFLQTPNGGNTKTENIKLLLNEQANKNDFWAATGWLKTKNLKKGDSLYLYFSGHGVATTENVYYFLPYDCYPNNDENNYEMTGTIEISKVKYLVIKRYVDCGVKVILIMDACRSDQVPRNKETPMNYTNEFIVQKPMGEVMLLSTGPGQVSIESPAIGNGHGLYTYYLVDGLAGAADKDPYGDNDGKVSLEEIGTYVKNMVKKKAKADFTTDQIPWSCCPDKDLSIVAKVDPQTYTAWEKSKELQKLSADQGLFAVNTVRPGEKGGDLGGHDTSQINVYNRFVDALEEGKLVGDASAEALYKKMENDWPGNKLTEDAKYSLAAKYLNFCQQKINLFLSGKGLIHIVSMEKELSKDQKENDKAGMSDLDEQIKRLKTLVTTGFDVADTMMQKAMILLRKDQELVEIIRPKSYFLRTMAAYANKSRKPRELVDFCHELIESDPSSPSGYLLMGWIYQDLQDDSCKYYFDKAAAMAPKWAYPVNGLGNYYISKNNKEKALEYFFKAVKLDSLNSSAYRSIAMTYFNQKKHEEAKKMAYKAYQIDPTDKYATELYATINAEFIQPEFGTGYSDSTYFKVSRRFYLKSIDTDSGFATAYKKLSELYSHAKNEDSALYWLQTCVAINPDDAEAYRNLGTYHLTKSKDTVSAEAEFKKAISLDPSTGDNYFSLARLYRKQKNKKKAIDVYLNALDKIGNNRDLYNELGNTYFEAPSEFEKAITYYNKALQMDPSLAYVYFNLGKLYGVKDAVKDSSVYYYSQAVLYDPDRFQQMNRTITDYYDNNKKTNEVKAFYRQSLDKGIASKFWLSWYADRLITKLIEEKNFAEAESTLKQYLDPQRDTDKDLYKKLADAIKMASENN